MSIEDENASLEVTNQALEDALEPQAVDPAAETAILPQAPESPYLPGMEPQDSLDVEGGADA